MKSNYSCSITISANIQWIPDTVEKIMDFLKSYMYLNEEIVFETRVILNELLVNAVVHGNKKDNSKKVHVKAGVCEDHRIYIIVEDEGEGLVIEEKLCNEEVFDCNAAVEVFCLNESGRGLIITSSLCDSLKRNKKGNKVVVLKRPVKGI